MTTNERKVAIVTGSATGVGAAACILLAERGCNVVVNFTRSEKEAEATAATCRAKGAEAITFQADVSDDDACRAMAQAAVDAWGRIDYLINNAARTKFNPYPKLDGVSKQDFLGHLRGECRRCLPDDSRGRAAHAQTGPRCNRQ
jgi:3-oxoacyl-[acyl-carrier protein] reductase